MAEVVRNNSPKVEIEEGRSGWIYVLGIIILLIIGFFIFRGRNILPGKTVDNKAVSALTPTPTAQIFVTIEAIVEQTVATQNTFFIKSASGFTTLSFTPQTAFTWSTGKAAASSDVRSGMTLRAEGKPDGRVFQAVKITLPGGEGASTTMTGPQGTAAGSGTSKTVPTPTLYKALPNTGIVE